MDPKQNTKPLDPKLQEAYDRVMGISLDASATSNPSTTSSEPNVSGPGTASITPTPTSNPSINPLTTNSGQDAASIPATPAPSPMINTTDPILSSSPLDATQNPVGPTLDSVPLLVTTPPSTMPTPSDPVLSTPSPSDLSKTEPTLASPVTQPEVNPLVTEPTSLNSSAPVASESLQASIPLAHSSETVTIGSLTGGVVKKSGKGISPVLIIIGGIAFLIVYVLFWVKIFGLSLPFISQ